MQKANSSSWLLDDKTDLINITVLEDPYFYVIIILSVRVFKEIICFIKIPNV